MTNIATLSEFLDASGVVWRIHDMSRRVTELSPAVLRDIEKGARPFPTPRLHKAWLAITFWQPHQAENAPITPYIWFVALPLDERGAFQHAAMQHFMSIIVEALGQQPTADLTESQEQRLKQNPYIFQPDEARRAAFHAQISASLGNEPSIHYEHAEAFFAGKSDLDWQLLGVQGIHDVAVRCLQQPAIQLLIHQQYIHFPEPLQEALCLALEQVKLPSALQQNLLALRTQLESPVQNIRLLRCVSARSEEPAVRQWLRHLFVSSQSFPSDAQRELLLVIAARCWQALQDPGLLNAYFSQVAEYDLQLFVQLYKELVSIAELRPLCLGLLYQQDLSPKLQEAFMALKQSVQAQGNV